jgi:hypothetical protein
MKRLAILILLITLSISANNSYGRQFRVGQIPNGSKIQCANCHVSPGGPRNDFGKAVANGFLDGSGNVLWGPELASLDSDGDGYSNGHELGDPEGSWSVGKPNPGDANNLGNPGDKSSFPTTAFVFDADNLPWFAAISSLEVSPNPVSYISTLSLDMKENSFLTIDIISTEGKYIGSLFNGFATAGKMNLNLNLSKLNIGSGMYVVYVTSGNTSVVKKISVVK